MQTNSIESVFLDIKETPKITSSKQSINILHNCGCELNQHFFIGFKGRFKSENQRHLHIKLCELHKNK